ncbi:MULTISPECIES: thiaminase II [Acidianus]|uniref:TenA family transcriptional regulator n=1 Tax=Candidatus Acidianus copahuensis TaxID=1160895 RepID=A0A031LJW2_9CREN|nr:MULTISPECIES: thiaminase II [Acidianus]EZQ01519.1 TenA family transcriptional regulator [Candidatus Acidianus copahuensis]NON61632.1 thiaminase II [Acidianus sp. RZ1]
MLSDDLWESISDIYSSILSHPFIKGLTDGTLEEEKFRYYILQDFLYLREFGKALALLSAKADTQEASLLLATHVTHAIEVEKSLHQYFISLWKVNPSSVNPSPTNLLYTSYISSIAYSRPFYEGLASVLPCYWIYMEVGKELLKRGSPNPLYKRWIETYGGEEYEKGVRAVLEIVNSFKLTEEQKSAVKRHFRITSMFEYMFWDSAYKLEKFPFVL